jgi:hypothetical protein
MCVNLITRPLELKITKIWHKKYNNLSNKTMEINMSFQIS